jgi:acyl-CoA hydrolase
MEPNPVAESHVLLAHWMGPTDANGSGNIHGGTIMKLADEAAGLAAIKHSRTLVTTAGVDRMAFLVPVFIGELVTFKAMVNAAWRTSMEIGVRVEAEDPLTGEVRHTNSAYFTFVALDKERRPTPVAPASAGTPLEQRRMHDAELRRNNRLTERAEMLARRRVDGDF